MFLLSCLPNAKVAVSLSSSGSRYEWYMGSISFMAMYIGGKWHFNLAKPCKYHADSDSQHSS